MDDFMFFLETGEKERQHHQQQQQQQHLKAAAAAGAQKGAATSSAAGSTRHLRRQEQQEQQHGHRDYDSRHSIISKKTKGSLPTGTTPPRYFAVRSCHSLQAPAIFCCWEDCSVYVDSDDDLNDSTVTDPEFQVFDHLKKAVEYIDIYLIDHRQQHHHQEEEDEHEHEQQPTTAGQHSGTSISQSSSRKRPADTIALFSQDGQVRQQHHQHMNRKKLPFVSATATTTTTTTMTNTTPVVTIDVPPINPATARAAAIAAAASRTKNAWESHLPSRRGNHHHQNDDMHRSSHDDDDGDDDDDDDNNNDDDDEDVEEGESGYVSNDEAREFEEMFREFERITVENKPIKTVPNLQTWVHRQRKEYVAFRNESPNTTMTASRLARMTAIGFPFEAKHKMPWEERAAQWHEFHSKHGRNPTIEDNRTLHKWCYQQKAKYHANKAGKKTNLTEEKIQKLTDWGFVWEILKVQPATKDSIKSWEERFAELVEFKKHHGHTSPPHQLPGLGQWCRKIQTQYRKYLKGEKCKLTREKLAKLREIDFDFASSRDKKRQQKEEEAKYRDKTKRNKKRGRPAREVQVQTDDDDDDDEEQQSTGDGDGVDKGDKPKSKRRKRGGQRKGKAKTKDQMIEDENDGDDKNDDGNNDDNDNGV